MPVRRSTADRGKGWGVPSWLLWAAADGARAMVSSQNLQKERWTKEVSLPRPPHGPPCPRDRLTSGKAPSLITSRVTGRLRPAPVHHLLLLRCLQAPPGGFLCVRMSGMRGLGVVGNVEGYGIGKGNAGWWGGCESVQEDVGSRQGRGGIKRDKEEGCGRSWRFQRCTGGGRGTGGFGRVISAIKINILMPYF